MGWLVSDRVREKVNESEDPHSKLCAGDGSRLSWFNSWRLFSFAVAVPMSPFKKLSH